MFYSLQDFQKSPSQRKTMDSPWICKTIFPLSFSESCRIIEVITRFFQQLMNVESFRNLYRSLDRRIRNFQNYEKFEVLHINLSDWCKFRKFMPIYVNFANFGKTAKEKLTQNNLINKNITIVPHFLLFYSHFFANYFRYESFFSLCFCCLGSTFSNGFLWELLGHQIKKLVITKLWKIRAL